MGCFYNWGTTSVVLAGFNVIFNLKLPVIFYVTKFKQDFETYRGWAIIWVAFRGDGSQDTFSTWNCFPPKFILIMVAHKLIPKLTHLSLMDKSFFLTKLIVSIKFPLLIKLVKIAGYIILENVLFSLRVASNALKLLYVVI